MQIYCVFCGAPATARARFCRACRRLIALPGGTTSTPTVGSSPWPGEVPAAGRSAGGGWPDAGGAPATFVSAPREPAFGRPGPAADTWRDAAPGTTIMAAPYLASPGMHPPSRPLPTAPLLSLGRVEYLIDTRTGFPYDPHHQALVPAARIESVAAFFPRLGALLVDYCILSVLWFGLVGAAALVDSAVLGLLATFLGPALYFILFWSTGGRTPGQRAAGLQLLRTDGSRVGLRDAVVRYLGTLLSLPLFFLGYLWMLWDPAGQTWHDKLADTMVVQS